MAVGKFFEQLEAAPTLISGGNRHLVQSWCGPQTNNRRHIWQYIRDCSGANATVETLLMNMATTLKPECRKKHCNIHQYRDIGWRLNCEKENLFEKDQL